MAQIKDKSIFHPLVEWDIKVFVLVNKKMRNRALNILMPLITQLGNGFVTLLISSLSFYLIYRLTGVKEIMVMKKIVEVAVLGSIVVQIIKNYFDRERPARKIEDIQILGPKLQFSSFPSGHTMSAFALAVILSERYPFLSLFLYLIAFLVGISRIYVGAHYPLDVLVGCFLGIICAKAVLILPPIW